MAQFVHVADSEGKYMVVYCMAVPMLFCAVAVCFQSLIVDF